MCLPGAGFQKSEFLQVIGLVNFGENPIPVMWLANNERRRAVSGTFA